MPQWSYRRDLPHLQRRRRSEYAGRRRLQRNVPMLRCLPVPGGLPGSGQVQIVRAVARRRPVRQDQSILHLQGVVTLRLPAGSVGYFPVEMRSA